MNTSQALVVYIVAIVFIFALLIRIRIKIWSAIVVTLLIGQILLNILCPPSNVSPWSPDSESLSSSMAIYIMIQLVTPLIAIIYIFATGWYDRHTINSTKI
jgi:hypothetical protein